MDTKKEEKLHSGRPYDDTMWEHWSMYDNMPYVWDSNLNMGGPLKLESGNIIKAYRCKLKDPYEIKHE